MLISEIIDLELNGLKLLRIIGIALCKLIYKLISILFQLFTTVSRLNILSSDEIAPIYQRVTMFLTIVMVFYITFEFVKYVITPDTITDKEKGASKLVYRLIMVVLLIAFVPKIFSIAYKFQNRVIENQIFSKVILGKKNMDFDTYGSDFSANVLGLFYKPDEEVCGNNCSEAEKIVNSNLNTLRTTGQTRYLDQEINETEKVKINGKSEKKFIIEFDGLMAVAVGGFILYILVLYSIDVGTRYAQLIFLQIMSPVAIISYISPKKDGMFQKWGKQCITTYIDLFIRLAIIYFILLIVQVLGDAYDSGSLFEGLGEISPGLKVLCYVALIMGCLVFANKAPKLLQDLLPSSGAAGIGFGFGSKDRFEPAKKAIQGSAKAIAAPVRTGRRVAGGISGFGVGMKTAIEEREKFNKKRGLSTAYSGLKAGFRGAKAGIKKDGGIKKANEAARASVQKDIDIVGNGGTVLGHDFRGGHYQQESYDIKKEIEGKEAITKAKDSVSSAVKDMKIYKTASSYNEDWKTNGIGDASQREAAMKAIEKAMRVYAVSNRDAASKTAFENSIKEGLDKVYTEAAALDNFNGPLTQSQQKIIAERNKVLSNIISNMEIGSTKWDTVSIEIEEAKKVSNGQTYAGGTITDATSLEDFAKDIGDVSDAAITEATRLKYAEETKKANANASGDKK